MLATAALACLKHSARAALTSTFAASAEKEAPRNGTSKATAKRVLVLSMVAFLRKLRPAGLVARYELGASQIFVSPARNTVSGAAAAAMQ